MRRIKILYSLSRNGLPVLVFAALVPTGEACSLDDPPGPSDAASGGSTAAGAGGTSNGDASAGTGGAGGIIISTGGSGGSGGAGGRVCIEAGAPPDPRYDYPTGQGSLRQCCDFFIDLPPEGTPAMIDTVCVDSGGPVQSGWAARVTLTGGVTPPLEGRIVIGRAFADRVVGLPTVQAIDASEPAWKDMIVDNMQPLAGGGFSFNFAWPNPPAMREGVRITLEVTFSVQCEGEAGMDAGSTRTVQALTNVLYCTDSARFSRWVSSGDICHVCAIIAEMAPTPIVPSAHDDPLPLGEALRLSVKTLAQVGRSFVLLAEHDGGSGDFHYTWRASAGDLRRVARDVVVWTPPDEGMLELVQVAVESARAAGVASMRWDRAA